MVYRRVLILFEICYENKTVLKIFNYYWSASMNYSRKNHFSNRTQELSWNDYLRENDL